MLFVLGLLQRVGRHQAYLLLGLAVLVVVAGGIAFATIEDVGIGTGLYWSVTTATTVGYGDVTPHDSPGRVIAASVMLTTIPLVAGAFATFTATLTSLHVKTLITGLERKLLPDQPYVAVYGDHVIVPSVTRDLLAGELEVLVVGNADPDEFPQRVHVLAGDPTAENIVSKSVEGPVARALVAMADEGDAMVTTVLLRHLAPQLPITVIVHSAHVARAMEDLGVEQALSAEELLGHLMAKSLEAPHAAELMRAMVDSDRYGVREIELPPELVGKMLSEARRSSADLLLAVVHDSEVIMAVGTDPMLDAGDRLLVLRSLAGREPAPS